MKNPTNSACSTSIPSQTQACQAIPAHPLRMTHQEVRSVSCLPWLNPTSLSARTRSKHALARRNFPKLFPASRQILSITSVFQSGLQPIGITIEQVPTRNLISWIRDERARCHSLRHRGDPCNGATSNSKLKPRRREHSITMNQYR